MQRFVSIDKVGNTDVGAHIDAGKATPTERVLFGRVAPVGFVRGVIADLNGRRAKIRAADSQNGVRMVNARVPLAEMFGYATDLRSMTQGRATDTRQFSGYALVRQSIARTVKEEGV